MKITAEHYEVIRKAFRDNATQIVKHFNYLKSPQCVRKPSDFEKRLRWDIFFYVLAGNREFLNKLYEYLNDDNIDTALRAVMEEIKSEKDLKKLLS